MVTYYVDLEEYKKGLEVVHEYVDELKSEGATEMASSVLVYVHAQYCTS